MPLSPLSSLIEPSFRLPPLIPDSGRAAGLKP